jgi:hypothetical protein
MDEILVTQIGLLLTQFRYTRRALEDIERSTARYGGVTFALALAEGPRFGAPPLVGGALKVYVTNINDLTVGRGAAGLFEGLLGGIGRFIGGLGGGLVGGVIGGVSLWVWVGKLQDIVKGINNILDRFGIFAETGPAKEKPGKKDLASTLECFQPIIKSSTALFDAAARGPEAAGKSAAEGLSDEARAWGAQLATTLASFVDSLTAADKLVKSLTLFVPVLIGALAWLLSQLDTIKLAILDLLQFALRITLLLRGAALVTIYDTISAVARLGASILDILKGAVTTILNAILAMLGAILGTVEELLKFAGSGLANAMNGLLEWLVNGLGRVLTYIGSLRIFQLVTHLVQVLPSMLPALITLVHGSEASIDPEDRKWLEGIKDKALTGPTGPAVNVPLPTEYKFPDLGDKFLETVQPFKDKLKETSELLPQKSTEAFDAARDALRGIDSKMQEALTKGETGFETRLTGQMKQVSDDARALAGKLTPAVEAASDLAKKGEADAGLRAISQAYENWLKADGLKTVLDKITDYFASARAGAPSAPPAAVPGAVVGTARPEAARATVEIGEIVIELEPSRPRAETKPAGSELLGLLPPADLLAYDEGLERGAV